MPFRKPTGDKRVRPSVGSILDFSDPINVGLIGRWTFSEGAGGRVYDLARKNHGDIVGPDWLNKSKGVYLDGTTDVVNFPYQCFDIERTLPWSHVYWITLTTATPSTVMTLLSKVVSATVEGVLVSLRGDLANDPIEVGLRGSTTELNVRSNQTWVAGRPTQIAITYDGSTTVGGVSIYRDGVLQSQSSSSNTLNQSILGNSDLRMGAWGSSSSGPFTGNFDNASFYKRRLLPQEVARLFSEPYAGIYSPRRRIISAVPGNFLARSVFVRQAVNRASTY